MAELPTDGGSEGIWAALYNAFLLIGHNANGTHKAAEVTPVVTGEGIFGSWTNLDSESNTLVKNGVYKVGSDGFVMVETSTTGSTNIGFTDGNNPPTKRRAANHSASGQYGSINFPVRKNDYWKVTATATPTIYWLPIGTGTSVKQ